VGTRSLPQGSCRILPWQKFPAPLCKSLLHQAQKSDSNRTGPTQTRLSQGRRDVNGQGPELGACGPATPADVQECSPAIGK